jgi:3-methyladenine DNA glycosylase/8-oxoguanine DNA glycosylase
MPRVDDRFASLARAVAYQQLAGSAAAAIWGRAVGAIEAAGHRVDPAGVMAIGEGPLRAAGLSGSKVATLTALAEACLDGSVDLARAGRASDEAVTEQLVQVRGIGVWTAQMFLMNALHRLDVWPVGDLGVRNGFALAFDHDALPTPKALDALGEPYRPYRSILAWWCWQEVHASRATAKG